MKRFLLSVILGFSLLTPLASYATHASGVELRYEHLSGNTFRFHLILFRDCSGIAGSPQYTITGNSDCGDYVNFTVDSDSVANVSQVCDFYTDRCVNNNSPYMGIQAWYYHGDVAIDSVCSLWTFGLAPICNRNLAITNLIGGGNAWCTYIETKLNNLDAPDNSSPVFTALPLFHLCNQVQYLHLYAQDADGDSLVFEMYSPHSDPTSDVQYINSLSAFQPVTYTLPADSTRFDPLTGDIRFKANGFQITVVGVRVNEFRNGVFIGSEERDIEVIFSNCTYHAPVATGINGSFTTFVSHICADSLLTFHVNTSDIDGDSVRISWQNNIPGSTINLSGVNNQNANFNWQPTASQISNDPYTFILYVTDSTCPYVYYNSNQYYIYVDSCFAITGIGNPDVGVSFSATYSSSDQAFVYQIESKESLNGKVYLIDLQGRTLWKEELKLNKEMRGIIPASSLSPGIYLLQMKTLNGESGTLKVMKN